MSEKNNQGSKTKPLSPDKQSKRSKRRKNRKFISLDVSSRKHRRAKGRIYQNTEPNKSKGKVNYH